MLPQCIIMLMFSHTQLSLDTPLKKLGNLKFMTLLQIIALLFIIPNPNQLLEKFVKFTILNHILPKSITEILGKKPSLLMELIL